MGALFSCCRDRVPSKLILQDLGHWAKPSDDIAKSETQFFSSHHDAFSVFGSTTEDLSEFGEGHTLYFYFLKWFSCLFFFLFMLTGLPSLLFNVAGDYYEGTLPGIITMGNVGVFKDVDASQMIANATFGASEFEVEEAIVYFFHHSNVSDEEPAYLGPTSITKEDAHIVLSILDFMGYVFTLEDNRKDCYKSWVHQSCLQLHLAAITHTLHFTNACEVDFSGRTVWSGFPMRWVPNLLGLQLLDRAIVYFVVTMVIIRAQNKVAKRVNISTVTIADYSVYVTRIPGTTKSDEIREFFGQYGEVLTTELVKTDCELISCVKEKSMVADQLEACRAFVQKEATKKPDGRVPRTYMNDIPKWEDKAERCMSYTNDLLATRGTAQAVCAFVTFQEEAQKLSVLEAYPNSFARRLFMSRAKRFRGKHRIKVRAAAEPTNIFWENLQFGTLYRGKRKALTTAVKYLALLIGFFLMNLATSMKSGGNTWDEDLCDASCDYFDESGGLDLDDALRETYKSCWKDTSQDCSPSESSCYACYCNKIILNLGSEKKYCKEYISSFAKRTASRVVAVSAVVVINLALTALAIKLSSYERHHTRISEERSLAHKLFLLQFVNTVISYLVATTHVARLKSIVRGTPVEGLLFEGIFIDTTPTWYEEVGRSLTITMVAQCGVRLARVALKYFIFKWHFWWRGTTVTQTQLNDCFTGPEFELAPRYGELLNLIFVTMLFGAGLPILYLVTAVSFFLQYWAEKAELLKLSRRPTAYGPDLAKMAGNLLPYAALWHLAFAMWSFSFYKTARSPLVSEQSASHVEWFLGLFYWIFKTDGDHVNAKEHAHRMLQQNAAHHLVGVILVALILIAKVTMSTWISAVRQLASFLGIIKDTDGEISHGTGYPKFSNAVNSKLLVGPTSYAIKSNPKYMHALATIRGWNTLDREVPADILPQAAGDTQDALLLA